MARSMYKLDFFGLKRDLPISYLSPRLQIANFSILGDVELCEKAGELFEKKLKGKKLAPECFVSPQIKIVPFVHHLAKRFGHNRYVILRKSVRGYMVNPIVENPWHKAPKHVKKLVLSGTDKEYLRGKKVIVVDDVVSTGTTIEMTAALIKKVGGTVLAKCSIFKQGERYAKDLIYLKSLPIIVR